MINDAQVCSQSAPTARRQVLINGAVISEQYAPSSALTSSCTCTLCARSCPDPPQKLTGERVRRSGLAADSAVDAEERLRRITPRRCAPPILPMVARSASYAAGCRHGNRADLVHVALVAVCTTLVGLSSGESGIRASAEVAGRADPTPASACRLRRAPCPSHDDQVLLDEAYAFLDVARRHSAGPPRTMRDEIGPTLARRGRTSARNENQGSRTLSSLDALRAENRALHTQLAELQDFVGMLKIGHTQELAAARQQISRLTTELGVFEAEHRDRRALPSKECSAPTEKKGTDAHGWVRAKEADDAQSRGANDTRDKLRGHNAVSRLIARIMSTVPLMMCACGVLSLTLHRFSHSPASGVSFPGQQQQDGRAVHCRVIDRHPPVVSSSCGAIGVAAPHRGGYSESEDVRRREAQMVVACEAENGETEDKGALGQVDASGKLFPSEASTEGARSKERLVRGMPLIEGQPAARDAHENSPHLEDQNRVLGQRLSEGGEACSEILLTERTRLFLSQLNFILGLLFSLIQP